MKKISTLLTVLLVVCLLATACNSPTPTTNPTAGQMSPTPTPVVKGELQDKLVVGELLIPKNMNPLTNPNPFARRALGQIYEGLVLLDKDKKIVPGIAKEWTISADGMEYTFTLDENAKFTNGDPVTVEDISYCFDIMMKNAVAFVLLPDVKEFKVVSDTQVKLVLYGPSATQMQYLSMVLIASKKEVEAAGAEFGVTTKGMVGSGAYKAVDWQQGVSLTLERNDEYRFVKALTKTIEMRQLADPSTALSALESGEIQVTTNLLPTDYTLIESNPDLVLLKVASFNCDTFTFNLQYAPFKDPLVRKAVALAINRADANVVGTNGTGSVAGGFILQRGMPGFKENSDSAPLAFDKNAAIEALKASTFPTGFPLTISVYAGLSDKVGEVIMQNLKDIGIDASISIEATAGFGDKLRAGDYQSYIGGMTQLFGNPIELATFVITTGGNNVAKYSNAQVDALFAEAILEKDSAKLESIYTQIDSLLKTDNAFVPLYSSPNIAAVAKGVEGYIVSGTYDVQRFNELAYYK
jgi:peptide/nickel transport system substrate-binding protein